MIWILILLALIIYFVFDVHYFLRSVYHILAAKFLRRNTTILEPSEIYGICLPADADLMLTHMNNSRYLREFDFARFEWGTRNGVVPEILRRGGGFPVASMSMRYRLPLMMFSTYKVVTTPVYYDEKTVYFDQRVITLSDKIVRAVGYVKMAITKVNFEQIAQKLNPGIKSPELPEDLKKWIEFNELSSEKMKK